MRRITTLLIISISYLLGNFGIATGGVGGTYYPFGEQISKVCGEEIGGLKAIETKGSLDNVERLIKESHIKFAIVQYDVLSEIKNNSRYDKRMRKLVNSLRIVMPLYKEDIHIIMRKGLKVNGIKDLKNLRVSIGNRGSGMNITATNISRILNFQWRNPVRKDIRESLEDILIGKLDAVIYNVGTPGRIFTVDDKEILDLYKNGYDILDIGKERELETIYKPSIIRKRDYQWLDGDRETKSIKSVLITYAYKKNQPSYRRVKKLYRCIYENISIFKNSEDFHPKWKEVNVTDFSGINWKIHNAVKEVLDEIGYEKIDTLAEEDSITDKKVRLLRKHLNSLYK